MDNHEVPHFEDQDYIKGALQVVVGLCLVSTGLLAAYTYAVGYNLTTIGLLLGVLSSIVMFVFVWRGYLRLPRLTFPPIAFTIVVFLIIVGEGIRDEAVLGFPLVIALAGLFLGRSWVAVYTILSIVALTIIGFGEIGSLMVAYDILPGNGIRIVIMDVLMLFLGALIYMVIDNFERALKRIRQSEEQLAESNQTLLDFQAELENRITERVNSLNVARLEAEKARQVMEAQSWKSSSLAQLGDVMRGGQDIPTLANNVIQYLCVRLNAQVGMIFLSEGKYLKMLGGYACECDQQTHFELGEGLIGQAALEKKPILLDEIPPDAIRIVTGLGDVLPRHVIAVPFLFDKQVIGVLGVGTTGTFSENHLDYLSSAAERIGVSFHTALTRARVDQLLDQTRRQAEELRLREEELRAINEELEAQAANLKLADGEMQA